MAGPRLENPQPIYLRHLALTQRECGQTNERDAYDAKGGVFGHPANRRYFHVGIIKADVITTPGREARNGQLCGGGGRREVKGFECSTLPMTMEASAVDPHKYLVAFCARTAKSYKLRLRTIRLIDSCQFGPQSA